MQTSKRPFRRKSSTSGIARSGIRGDLRLVLNNDRPEVDVEPMADKPAALINSVRYFGDREGRTPASAMTAAAAALYEYLLAAARLELKDKSEHLVTFADAKAYLNIEKTSRLLEHMDALSSTWVSYDFLDLEKGIQRIGRRVQLLACEEVVDRSGVRHISYFMHPSVRKVILEARRYTYVELGAFPRFSSKYTARLYPKLALMAGRDYRPAMEWTPEELAEELGFQPTGAFKFSNFEARVLRPVLKDISDHVRRFDIECGYERSDTRGNPVTKIVITVGALRKVDVESKMSDITKKDRNSVAKIARTSAVGMTQMPGEDMLRRASERLGMSVPAVADAWTREFDNPTLMHTLEREGLKTAFESWIQGQEDDIDFEHATHVVVRCADGYDISMIQKIIEDHQWTGSKSKTLRIYWVLDGVNIVDDVIVTATERDLAMLMYANQDIIEDMEYAI